MSNLVGSPSGLGLPHERNPMRLLVDGIRDYAICMLDAGGQVSSANTGVQAMTGFAAEEMVGRPVAMFYPEESIARGSPATDLEIARTEGRFEDDGWRMRRDGSRFWASVVVTAIRENDDFLGYAMVMRDLTAQRLHEERLRESEERFRLLVESVKDYAIFMLAPDGTIASWNAGAQAMKGYTAPEIIGQHFSQFYPPDAVARRWPQHELAVAGSEGVFQDEGWRIRKDGTRFWANVVITALFDDRGRHRGFVKVTRDMTTNRRIEELERTQRRQHEFLAMLAHELRNPLAPIRTAVNLIETVRSDDPMLRRTHQVLDRQVAHLTRLVDDLLDMSRVTQERITLRKIPATLNDIALGALESSRPLIDARGHQLALDVPVEPVRVFADDTRLTQVLVNLLNNAAKYTPPGGRIDLRVYRDGALGIVRVRDNGVGMAPELRATAFDLFVQGERTPDRAEGGLGLGLTIAKRLVDMHGGSIGAFSEGPGKGSEFVVRLPIME